MNFSLANKVFFMLFECFHDIESVECKKKVLLIDPFSKCYQNDFFRHPHEKTIFTNKCESINVKYTMRRFWIDIIFGQGIIQFLVSIAFITEKLELSVELPYKIG